MFNFNKAPAPKPENLDKVEVPKEDSFEAKMASEGKKLRYDPVTNNPLDFYTDSEWAEVQQSSREN